MFFSPRSGLFQFLVRFVLCTYLFLNREQCGSIMFPPIWTPVKTLAKAFTQDDAFDKKNAQVIAKAPPANQINAVADFKNPSLQLIEFSVDLKSETKRLQYKKNQSLFSINPTATRIIPTEQKRKNGRENKGNFS